MRWKKSNIFVKFSWIENYWMNLWDWSCFKHPSEKQCKCASFSFLVFDYSRYIFLSNSSPSRNPGEISNSTCFCCHVDILNWFSFQIVRLIYHFIFPILFDFYVNVECWFISFCGCSLLPRLRCVDLAAKNLRSFGIRISVRIMNFLRVYFLYIKLYLQRERSEVFCAHNLFSLNNPTISTPANACCGIRERFENFMFYLPAFKLLMQMLCK